AGPPMAAIAQFVMISPRDWRLTAEAEMRLTGSLLASLGAALLTATAFGKEPQAVCGKFSRLLDEEGMTPLYALAVYAIDAPKYGGHKYASLDADGVDAVLYG